MIIGTARPITDVGLRPRPIPDLAAGDFTAEKPGEKMVGDITYIFSRSGGWLYLVPVIPQART